jgi:hypothetical protein
MTKILFTLNGKQSLVEVGQGGGVSSDADVLWDERIHGPMPEGIELGKMKVTFVDSTILNDEGEFEDVKVRTLQKMSRRTSAHVAAVDAEDAKKEEMEARKYLADTDWYIIRELDSGEPCPADIKAARAQARLKIGQTG